VKKIKAEFVLALILVGTFLTTTRIPVGKAASSTQINDAIIAGLDYLNQTQAADGHWGGSYYPVACTGMAVLAFENFGHLPGDLADPYHITVEKGLDYLFTQAHVQTLTAQPAGDPDTNGNGIGIYFSASDTIYQTPMVLMAIVASQAPSRTATTGPANVNGRSYYDITVDIVDWITWAQNEAGNGRGGWRYSPNYGSSDNSNTQWPLLGLLTAKLWGINAPAWVKTELLMWLTYSQNLAGDYNTNSRYGSFGYTAPTDINSIAESATGIMGLTYCDVPKTDSRVIAAQGYIVRDWLTSSGWRSNFGNLYAMYAVMKACRLAIPTPIKYIVDYTGAPTIEWYNGTGQYADWLVAHQQVDGHWEGVQASTNDDLNTAWGVLILEYVPVVVKYKLTVNVVDATTNDPISGATVTADGPETRSDVTDGGEVVFADIQAGSYQVSASKTGYASASTTVELTADTSITLKLAPLMLPVYIDIKPGSWPNPINVGSQGVFAVAICGTKDFDVMTIDPTTVRISIKRDTNGDGVSALRWSYEDVATPWTGEPGGGHALGGDGYMDLVFHFSTQAVVTTLTLTGHAGETLPLIIRGNLYKAFDGTPIMGQDWVWILNSRR